MTTKTAIGLTYAALLAGLGLDGSKRIDQADSKQKSITPQKIKSSEQRLKDAGIQHYQSKTPPKQNPQYDTAAGPSRKAGRR